MEWESKRWRVFGEGRGGGGVDGLAICSTFTSPGGLISRDIGSARVSSWVAMLFNSEAMSLERENRQGVGLGFYNNSHPSAHSSHTIPHLACLLLVALKEPRLTLQAATTSGRPVEATNKLSFIS